MQAFPIEGAEDKQRNHLIEDKLSRGVGDVVEIVWKEKGQVPGVQTNTNSRS